MAGVALVLLVERQSGSYSIAGLAAALFAGGAAVGGLGYARLITRIGYAVPLTAGGVAGATGLALIPIVARSAWPPAYLAFIAVAGVLFPPLAACVRSQWNRAYSDPDRLMRAATFESVVGEIAFLVGPALVTVAVAVSSDALPFLIAGAMIALASIGFARYAVEPPAADWTPSLGQRLPWHRTFALTLVAGALWCVSFGALTVGIVAASQDAGRRELSGLFIAVISVGAILGGLSFGARTWDVDPGRLLVTVLAAYSACLAPLVLAHRAVAAFVLVLLVAGTTSAVVLACLNLRVVEDVPPASEVEAYSWLNGFTVAGLAIGPAVGGQIVDRVGAEGAFASASALAAVAAIAALRGRSP
jgi:MFS family permease